MNGFKATGYANKYVCVCFTGQQRFCRVVASQIKILLGLKESSLFFINISDKINH